MSAIETRACLDVAIGRYCDGRAGYEEIEVAIEAFEAVVREEALAPRATVRLGDLRGFVDVINEACTCGGGGPELGCPACQVYHAIGDWQVIGDAILGAKP
jgi:hypothetical protein